MGSVLDYVTCPHCGSMAYNDYYYKSGEEYTWCCECGYYHTYEYIFDKNKSENEFVEKKCDNPYGYYSVSLIDENRMGMGGSLDNEEEWNEILKKLLKSEKDSLKSIKLSRFIDGKIVLKEVYNRERYSRKKKLEKIINNV